MELLAAAGRGAPVRQGGVSAAETSCFGFRVGVWGFGFGIRGFGFWVRAGSRADLGRRLP